MLQSYVLVWQEESLIQLLKNLRHHVNYVGNSYDLPSDKGDERILWKLKGTVRRKVKNHCYNQWDDWACICTTSLETPGCMLVRTNLMSFSTSSLFLDFCFNVDKGWKSSIKDRSSYQNLGAWGKLSEGWPNQLLRGPLRNIYTRVKCCLILKSIWLTSYLIKSDSRVHEFFWHSNANTCIFHLEHSVIYLVMASN